MNFPLLDTITWIVVLLVLAAGLFLAVFASRQGRHWVIAPVVMLVVVAIVFALLGGVATAPGIGFHLTAVALLLLIGVVGGSPLVLVVLELAGSDKVALGEHGGILIDNQTTASGTKSSSAKKEQREILRGGATIGYLERLGIIGAALAGQFAAVAIVVAVKGLGRFSELETSAARERFIIGTLVSIVWAAACAAPAVIG